MATWPSKFPRPQRVNYSGVTQLATRETQFPSSTKRRRVFEDAFTIIQLQMYMDSSEQFHFFWSWLRHKAEEGADNIAMDILDSDGTVQSITGYIVPGSVTWEFKETVWVLQFNFRIPSFTVPIESALDTYLAS